MKDSRLLKTGDIFFHESRRPERKHAPEAIWLVVYDANKLALSVNTGVMVEIGPGPVLVFDNVDFLDLDRMRRPNKMNGGNVFMSLDSMLVKSSNGKYFSFDGSPAPLPNPKRRYQMMELHVGFKGHQLKAIRDFGLIR